MKQKLFSLITLLLAAHVSPATAQTLERRLSIDPNVVTAGTTVTLTYDAKDGPLASAKNVYALAYTYEDYRWKVADVLLEKGDSGRWYGPLYLPKSASMIALKFQDTLDSIPTAVDAGEQNVSSLRDSLSRALPGCRIGYAMLMKPSYHLGIEGYMPTDFQEISQRMAELYYGIEMQAYPNEANRYFKAIKAITLGHYADSTQAQRREAMEDLARVLEGTQQKTEEDLLNLCETYRNDLHDAARADSTEKILNELYPQNRISRRKAAEAVCRLEGEHFYTAAEAFRRDFPVNAWKARPDDDGHVYAMLYAIWVERLLNDRQFDRVAELLPEMDFSTIAALLQHTVLQPAKQRGKQARKLRKVAAQMEECLRGKTDETVDFHGVLLSPMQAHVLHTQQLDNIKRIK